MKICFCHGRSLVDVGVSTVLVIGGSGDYFEVADTVICMDSFKPKNVTAEAKRIAKEIGPPSAIASSSEPYGSIPRRALVSVFDGGVDYHCFLHCGLCGTILKIKTNC